MRRGAPLAATIFTALALQGARAARADPIPFATLAKDGIALANRDFGDRHHHWYDESLNDTDRYPQATIWGAVPLFEAIDAVEIAAPSRAAAQRVRRFALGAERYWDRRLGRRGGFAPYPGDRGGHEQAWFDDNGWWGLAFMDAYRATGEKRYAADAQRALEFTMSTGWDPVHGGLWWNTSHPYKAGEVMASGALLAARLAAETGRSADLPIAHRLLAWAQANLLSPDAPLIARSDIDPTPMPYVEGPLTEAYRTLCDVEHDQSSCDQAQALADRAYSRFATLSMGPQYDVIYLHTMMGYGRGAGDPRWLALARDEAAQALANAPDPGARGLYERAWDGSDMTQHQARKGMLRTHAATVELFAWLAAEKAS